MNLLRKRRRETREKVKLRLVTAPAPRVASPAASEHPPLVDDDALWGDSRTYMNIGPSHPAMHGAFRVAAKMNGEIIENSYSEFGFTHRGKEKLGEQRTYHQWIVYTDRLNYCSALINNVTYAMAVERLLGLELPERCIWLRMICCELSRVIDHLICIGISAVDSGAFSFFLYGFHQREEAYTLIEKLCGARLTTSYTRIGGLMNDAPPGWEAGLLDWVVRTRAAVKEMDQLLTKNRIWRGRTTGVGVFTRKQCLEYSFSGPNARAAGVDVDLRRDQPTMFYRDLSFEVPLGRNGDAYDRYLVRVEEIRQSLRILEECARRIRPGPIWCEDKRVRIPEKERVFNSMEAMIHHFMFFMYGFKVPPGEAYTSFEAANGELGFYIVSKGETKAHRLRVRGPSFWHYQGLDPMIRGQFLADFVVSFGSLNVIAGEIDR
ncbi:MAG: NADH-quinone oxidoreductase subunit D [Deltaproteobacteria bacterium]|nr:NADH-quinone oxidoreductase subunit D [Deltaproteobacteria bacterium]